MEKILRKEVLLSTKEYELLEKYLFGKSDNTYINKDVVIKDGESTKLFNVIIKSALKKEVTFTMTDYLKGDSVYEINCKSINDVMGVKKLSYLHLEDTLTFLINIKEDYNEEKYSTKYSYNRKKLARLKQNGEKSINNYLLEIQYADFTNETDLAFASYCFLSSNSIVMKKDKITELYFSKLRYIGYEIENFYNPRIIYNEEYIKNRLLKIRISSEAIRFLIGYIAYIRLSTDSNEERNNLELIRELSYNMTLRYIWTSK